MAAEHMRTVAERRSAADHRRLLAESLQAVKRTPSESLFVTPSESPPVCVCE